MTTRNSTDEIDGDPHSDASKVSRHRHRFPFVRERIAFLPASITCATEIRFTNKSSVAGCMHLLTGCISHCRIRRFPMSQPSKQIDASYLLVTRSFVRTGGSAPSIRETSRSETFPRMPSEVEPCRSKRIFPCFGVDDTTRGCAAKNRTACCHFCFPSLGVSKRRSSKTSAFHLCDLGFRRFGVSLDLLIRSDMPF